jgi:acetyl esterase/lipase
MLAPGILAAILATLQPAPITTRFTAIVAPERASPFFVAHRDLVYAERPDSESLLTSLDVYVPREEADEPRPILVYIHGGGWAVGDKAAVQRKPYWAAGHGWVFVSINYRLSPEVMHPEHARDTAAAIAYVRDHAEQWGGDPENIAIMGHSAGAHLAGIVACDESLLAEHGMTTDQLAGVVLLDGAGYNLPVRMTNLPKFGLLTGRYRDAFGDDPDLWTQASPTLQAQPGDNLAPLFCVHAGDREESRVEGSGLVAAWSNAGATSELYHAPDKDHAGINRRLGQPRDPDTRAIEMFLIGVFAGD